MKKRKLKLNKETVSRLDASMASKIKGGKLGMEQDLNAYTGGCTDGCTRLRTWWNCTKQDCTHDCWNASAPGYCH